jgi:hypothetical protein
MRETKYILILLFTILCSSVFTTSGTAYAVSVDEETCTPGEDGTCTSNLVEQDSSDDEDEFDEDEFDKDCEDDDESCTMYANQGGCTDNPGFMTYHCSKSCNTCDAVKKAFEAAEFVEDGSSKPCMDDHYQCSEWAGMGECEANPGKLRNIGGLSKMLSRLNSVHLPIGYMLRSCKRSCVVCYEGT